ncbi:Uncharacterised protein [Chromobacterium violaceum]|uniref:Uncharacterized protein n=1 Tax=Chromobacterium violaceum TaxID=536 RepID=A0A447T8Y7_CHRVL|nr:Uncharacterised protein [Chromobacterium violaceum]
MSQRQEKLQKEMWEEIHKEKHEKALEELRTIKNKLDTMNKDSDEYRKLEAEYNQKYQSAEEFFMIYYES